ncbi:hypothetical protein [Cryobacterium tepidiphilum]|uniref:hypothetical protein n=1 Tax=Cryobacterium tepidiphilum TaxID=2486026 RepID=UPI0011CD5561|nr:hypothetical protein [Cryobacterium tepidiphilum]
MSSWRATLFPLLKRTVPDIDRLRDELGSRLLTDGEECELFRPKRILWLGAWMTFGALTIPLFFTLYFLTIPTGTWVPFAVAHAVLVLAFAVVAQRLKAAGVLLAPDGIREREYFSRMAFTPVEAIATVMVVKLVDSYGEDVSRQLFMLDAEGRRLLRLRGQLWHAADFDRVVEYFSVPVRYIEPAMTWPEFRRSLGGNLAWWERRPILTNAILIAIFVAVAVSTLFAVMAAID